MRIRRHEEGAERLDFEEWPVLVDIPVAQTDPQWLGRFGNRTEGPWVFWVEANGVPLDGSPVYRYLVELREEDVSEILGRLPVGVVGAALDRLLREGNPEVIGAVVGRIVAHLARGAAGPENPWRE